MNILYITDNLTSSSVFKSQVHNLCNEHSKYNNVKLLAFCKLKDFNVDIYDAKYELISVLRLPLLSVPIIGKIQSVFFRDKTLLEWADVIHCRGHGPSLMAFLLQNKFNIFKPTITDIRGVVAEEVKNSKKSYINNFLYKQILRTEKYIFQRTNYNFFVTKNMQNYYSDLYNITNIKFSIFPTIVNEKFFHPMNEIGIEIRKRLELDNKFIYVYSGGQSYWQNLDNILLKFDEVSRVNNGIHLLLLVLNKDSVLNMMKELKITSDRITVMSLKYENVGKYLNACNAGLVIRDSSIINYVASPTKINEYLSCNLKIVDSLDKIGEIEYSSLVWQNNYMTLTNAVLKQLDIYKLLKD